MTAAKTRILLVDDDPSVIKFVSVNLKARGYDVLIARDGQAALDMLASETPDLIILDLMMPKVDGAQVVAAVRRSSHTPIIVLSALSDEAKKVELLDSGVDDYLTKPFGLQELLARVRAVLRRASSATASPPDVPLRAGDVTVDVASHQGWIGHEEIRLTPTEFNLLTLLLRHKNRVLTYDYLLAGVWGDEYRGNNQYLHIYIGRLRQKLAHAKDAEIVTYPGVGYSLRCE